MPNSSALRDALKQSPNNLSLLLLYGRACLEELHLDEAREVFTRALEQDPDQTDAMLGIAKVCSWKATPPAPPCVPSACCFSNPEQRPGPPAPQPRVPQRRRPQQGHRTL
jgi:tetratricopeptide (TPR) repeat protein